ncbi:hypothetical protein [Alicyclobacillus dauci]|uniref:Uncharacterized protein n=1 Tax=Alicyclobacillus dauci TaxID=1475485 RepID=A0ABY6YZX1_9BACL|nr:hypothetical protein [Alicyclobacillus dauci]WAH36177.1 hypothetical protein NZD86_18310 [Alicyclobacillus dauci]
MKTNIENALILGVREVEMGGDTLYFVDWCTDQEYSSRIFPNDLFFYEYVTGRRVTLNVKVTEFNGAVLYDIVKATFVNQAS